MTTGCAAPTALGQGPSSKALPGCPKQLLQHTQAGSCPSSPSAELQVQPPSLRPSQPSQGTPLGG